MNNRNNGGYPETVLFFLLGIGIVGYWITIAYKGGVPLFIIATAVFVLAQLISNFIKSLKDYMAGRKRSEYDMTGRNRQQDKWKRTYSGRDKTVYKKGNMTFTMNGSPWMTIIFGILPVALAYKNLRNGFQPGTLYTPFLLLLIGVMACISLYAGFRVLKDKKEENIENFLKDNYIPDENIAENYRRYDSMNYCCPYCGGKLDIKQDNVFCPHCGERLQDN